MLHKIGRRKFTQKIGSATVGFLALGHKGAAQGFPANEVLNIGCIGSRNTLSKTNADACGGSWCAVGGRV